MLPRLALPFAKPPALTVCGPTEFAETGTTIERTLTVREIDRAIRTFSVAGGGERYRIRANGGITRTDLIAVGNRVNATYTRSEVVSMALPGEAGDAAVISAYSRRALGQRSGPCARDASPCSDRRRSVLRSILGGSPTVNHPVRRTPRACGSTARRQANGGYISTRNKDMIDVASTAAGQSGERIARAFLTFGRIGFWIQFVFLIAVALLGAYVLAITGARARAGNILAFLGLAVPLFTTFWCWRYAKLGQLLALDPEDVSPSRPARTAWIGVWAGTIGGVVSLLSLFGAASALLIVMLANPQVGIQISPAEAGASAYTISAVDAVSIMSLLLTLTAELLVVAISLRLVFLVAAQTRRPAP